MPVAQVKAALSAPQSVQPLLQPRGAPNEEVSLAPRVGWRPRNLRHDRAILRLGVVADQHSAGFLGGRLSTQLEYPREHLRRHLEAEGAVLRPKLDVLGHQVVEGSARRMPANT